MSVNTVMMKKQRVYVSAVFVNKIIINEINIYL